MKKAKKVVGGAILLLAAQCKTQAQELRGFTSSPWSGVAQLSENPASIAGHMYKWDFILAGASVNLDNNFLYWNKNNTRFDFSDDALIQQPKANSTYFNYSQSIHGPALMYSINQRSAVAIGVRSRAQIALLNVSNQASLAYYTYANEVDTTVAGMNESFSLSGTVWQEYFATYATVLSDAGPTRQKLGVTAKVLLGNSQVQGDFSQIQYMQNGSDAQLDRASGSVHYSQNLDSLRPVNALLGANGYGFGVDIGYELEYRPNRVSCGFSRGGGADVCSGPQYLYKLGIALTDVGFTSFKNGRYATDFQYDGTEGINATQWVEGIADAEDASDSLNAVANATTNMGRYYTSLPTQLMVDVDYHVYKSVYVNAQGKLSVAQVFQQNSTFTPAELNLTPRIENSVWGFYAPLSINQYGNMDYGVGLRAGPLTLGLTDLRALHTKQSVNDVGAYIMFKSFFRCKKGRRGSNKVVCPSI